MDATTEKRTQFQKILQTVLICVWGALTVLLAVLLTLEVISSFESESVAVAEPFSVSTSLLQNVSDAHKVYAVELSGRISNPTKNAVRVEGLTVTIGADNAEKTLSFDAFVIPAYSEHEICYTFKSESAFYEVKRIKGALDGETVTLSNMAVQDQTAATGGAMAIYAAAIVCTVWLLVVAAKKRYYIFQELKMQE